MIGVYVVIYAYRLGLGHFRNPGPGLIFFLAGLFLIILDVIDLGRTFIKKPKIDKGNEEHPLWVGYQWQKVLLVIGGLSAYVFFFNAAGFLLSTFLLMVFLFRAVEPTKWWVSIVSGSVTILISYAIFRVWLAVPFPSGFLAF